MLIGLRNLLEFDLLFKPTDQFLFKKQSNGFLDKSDESDYFHNTDLASEPNKISEHFKANRHLENVN